MHKKIKKTFLSLAALVIISGSLFSLPIKAATSTQSMAIPAYEYPTLTNLWGDIDAAGGSNIPFVVVNPASGPGVSANPDYTTRISDNTSLGIRSIGYIDTSYQARPVSDVINDIDLWHSLYPESTGIFIDQVSAVDDAALCYTSYIYNYIKVNRPNDLVVQNFGTYTTPQYEPYGDIFVNAEMDYALYQTWTAPADGFQDDGANSNRFWHLVHTTSAANYPDALSDSQNNNAGWVYITDDALPNPYDEAASYFSTEVSDVALLPASSIPNRGVTDLPSGCLDTETSETSTISNGATSSVLSLTNTSSTYDSPGPNQIAFTLPTGVTLTSASGTDWSCTDEVCVYDGSLTAGSSSSDLSANFNVNCSYESGDIIATSTTFPSHQSTTNIAVSSPDDCPSGSTVNSSQGSELAETGSSAPIILALAGVLLLAGAGLTVKIKY